MQDRTRRHEARMMEAIAGLGGRSALSSEIDLRLGLVSTPLVTPGWMTTGAALLRKSWPSSGSTIGASRQMEVTVAGDLR